MLRFEPGVDKARRDVRVGALAMKKAGFLKKETDAEELAKNAWLDLDGVNDSWIKGLQVEKVAGGGRRPQLSPVDLAAIFKGEQCCQQGACQCCCGELQIPLTEEWAQVRAHQLSPAPNE
jgi:NitT/TauT family transport system substrate-binding protein